jgi:hypothetical protein
MTGLRILFKLNPLCRENKMKKLTLLAALTIASIGSAQALTISGGSFNLAEQTTEINQSGNLNLFDSNLGILNSVSFTFSSGMNTSFILTNTAAQSQSVIATGNVFLFAGSSVGAIDSLLNSISLSLAAGTGIINLAANAFGSFGPFADADSMVALFSSGFNAFQAAGGGVFDVTGESLSGLALQGGGGNIVAQQTTTAGIGASILYDYTERTTNVPEPAILGLMGLGFAAMGAMRRRRQA